MAGTTNRTTNHDTIRKWAEERGATPATVKGTGGQPGNTGVLRMQFPGYEESACRRSRGRSSSRSSTRRASSSSTRNTRAEASRAASSSW